MIDVNDLRKHLKDLNDERASKELELTETKVKLAISEFMMSRNLTQKKMRKHRNIRKLRTVIKNILIERDKELRPWAYIELPKASNKQLGHFGAIYGLERMPKETASNFRQRILSKMRGLK